MSDLILIERAEHLVTLTLNRPEAANAFSRALLAALDDAVRALAEDRDARAVVFTGAGEKAFSAGADLKERAGMNDDDVRAVVGTIRSSLDAVAHLPMPTIAAINGVAFGGGLELALACGIRVAAPGALMGLTETSLGVIPGGGGTQRLPRIVGPARARELIFTARRVVADEALRIGLVHEVADDAVERAREIAEAIGANGPIAVRAAKAAIDRGMELPLSEALGLEGELYERTIGTQDRLEGLAAFREKRAPVYRGE